ncbi:MAG: ABC transporter ATP-binding protein [Alphaproteobacteria bacterium]
MPDAPILEVKDIHKSFGTLEVLRGISLTANKGDVISILGSSGSGKSTFLRCINLLEVPTQGAITVEGEKITLKRAKDGQLHPTDSKQLSRIRSRLAMVFQGFNLWSHMSVLENIIEAPIHVLGLSRAEAIARAKDCMDKVGVYERKDHYPAQLSGGQQQRTAIARVLAMEPRAILFDEPTSALDPELVGEVLKVMRTLADEGRTMLVVTHEMAFARDVSDRVLFLDKGKVEVDSKPDIMFDQPASLSARWAEFVSNTRN